MWGSVAGSYNRVVGVAMDKNAWEIAKRLCKIQASLRKELLEELESHDDELDSVFNPYSYSPLLQDLRDRYLIRLSILQALIQQLVHYSQGYRKPSTRVSSVAAGDRNDAIRLVNRQLDKLNGTRVLDVKLIPCEDGREGEEWVGVITYVVNPTLGEPDEAPTWM